MKRFEVSGAVRPLYVSLGFEGLREILLFLLIMLLVWAAIAQSV